MIIVYIAISRRLQSCENDVFSGDVQILQEEKKGSSTPSLNGKSQRMWELWFHTIVIKSIKNDVFGVVITFLKLEFKVRCFLVSHCTMHHGTSNVSKCGSYYSCTFLSPTPDTITALVNFGKFQIISHFL